MGWSAVKIREMDISKGILNIYPLAEQEILQIISIAEYITVPKYSILIDENRTSKYLYFLVSGTCRIFYPKKEKEVILDFCFPGDFILPLNSYVHGTATYEIVESLEPCEIYRISISKLQELYESSLPIANWGRKLAEFETLKIEERLIQSLFKTAAERYHDLLEKQPTLLHHIKLGYIASYLGVSQVTLSRIRAGIK